MAPPSGVNEPPRPNSAFLGCPGQLGSLVRGLAPHLQWGDARFATLAVGPGREDQFEMEPRTPHPPTPHSSTPPPSVGDGAAVRAVQAMDRISSFLRRFSRRVAILAVAAVAGGAAIGVAVVRETPADNRLTVAVILGVLLALPPIVLGTFALAVRALAHFPQRVRESPDAVRSHAEDLGRRAREVADSRSG